LVRVTVGAILLIAVIFKTVALIGHGTWSIADWFFLSLISIEVGVALCLMLSKRVWVAWSLSLALFSGFACYSGISVFRGNDSCGCFGNLIVSPTLVFAIDVVVVAALLWLCGDSQVNDPAAGPAYTAQTWQMSSLGSIVRRWFPMRFEISTPIVCLLIGLLGGWAVSLLLRVERAVDENGRDLVTIEPETLVGKHFPFLSEIDIGQQLGIGDWQITLFRHDCSKCTEEFSKYENAKEDNELQNAIHPLAFIEIPPFAAVPTIRDVPSSCFYGRLSDNKTWVCKTPLKLQLSNGVMLRVIE
jgi:hypothetical protein